MAVEPARRRFTVQEYERLVEEGFFAPDERLELVDGEIVAMNPIGIRHAACVTRLTTLLGARLGEQGIVSVQNPVALGDRLELQPDVAVLRPRQDFYQYARPTASDTLLLIEVADATVAYDRSVKVPHYAATGVPEVWLADLPRDVVLVYQAPTANGYTVSHTARRGESLAPLTFPDLTVGVAELLG